MSCDVLVLEQYYHHHALCDCRVCVNAFVVLDSSQDCWVFMIMFMSMVHVIVHSVILFMIWFIMILAVFVIHIMIHMSESNCQFSSFIYLVRADYKEWLWWNSFTKLGALCLIIMYDFHVHCSYSSHLIRSSNHAACVFHFMLSIKSIKYESSLFLTIVDCGSDTCLSIRSFFKSHNKLTWNVECTLISDSSLSS